MENVIFLEVEGVLTTDSGYRYWQSHSGNIFIDNGVDLKFDLNASNNLNKIAQLANGKIVLITQWSKSKNAFDISNIFKKFGIDCEILDIINYDGLTDKGRKIKDWLDDNEILSYVVIDSSVEDIIPYIPENRVIEVDLFNGIGNDDNYKRAIMTLREPVERKKRTQTKLF